MSWIQEDEDFGEFGEGDPWYGFSRRNSFPGSTWSEHEVAELEEPWEPNSRSTTLIRQPDMPLSTFKTERVSKLPSYPQTWINGYTYRVKIDTNRLKTQEQVLQEALKMTYSRRKRTSPEMVTCALFKVEATRYKYKCAGVKYCERANAMLNRHEHLKVPSGAWSKDGKRIDHRFRRNCSTVVSTKYAQSVCENEHDEEVAPARLIFKQCDVEFDIVIPVDIVKTPHYHFTSSGLHRHYPPPPRAESSEGEPEQEAGEVASSPWVQDWLSNTDSEQAPVEESRALAGEELGAGLDERYSESPINDFTARFERAVRQEGTGWRDALQRKLGTISIEMERQTFNVDEKRARTRQNIRMNQLADEEIKQIEERKRGREQENEMLRGEMETASKQIERLRSNFDQIERMMQAR